MQLTQILTSLRASVLFFSLTSPAMGQTNASNKADEVILEMSQAFKKNDKAQLSRLLPKARGHTLEPWAAFWELRVRLDQASDSDIQQFLSQYAGTYAEDRLRNDWLLQLGRQRDWADFAKEYPRFRMNDDREVRCYALSTEALLSKPDTAAELKRLWYAFRDTEDGCTYTAEKLHDQKKIDALDVWRKARLAMDNNRPRAAQLALNIESSELGKQAILIHSDPQKYLDKHILAFSKKRKELSVLALIRIANIDPDKRLYVSTLQTMSRCFEQFSPAFFDLIVFDEAHRSIFNRFNEVIEYFDARMVGLTATPAHFIDRDTFLLRIFR